MTKNKQNLEIEKKKVPFNVLRKGVLVGILGVTMVTGAGLLTGCAGKKGEQGPAGTNGSTWLSGIETPTASQGTNGDFYFDTDDYNIYQKLEGGWTLIANIKGEKGDKGDTGATGPQGPAGEGGTSVYVGYDGYVWNGTERTEFQATNVTLGEDVVENTLELKDNRYFETSTISAGTKIVLMANYFEYINCTQYSSSVITELTTYVSENGKLDIGVINLSTGAYTLKTTEDVEEGINTLALDIEVAEGETLVLGGDTTTVDLYKTSGVEVDDEYGLFSTDLTNFTLSQTNEVNDKLIVNVKVNTQTIEETAIFPAMLTLAPEGTFANTSTFNPVTSTTSVFAYSTDGLFANKKITKIGVPVISLSTGTNANITIYKVASSTTSNFDTTYIEKYEVEIQNPTANKWCYGECNIEVGANEKLAIVYSADAFTCVYKLGQEGNNTEYAFVNNKGTAGNAYLLMDAYYENVVNGGSFSEHLQTLVTKNEEALLNIEKLQKQEELAEVLSDKNFSILGDSISTFVGYSNDSTNTNSTIGSNNIYYDTELAVTDTWWHQTAEITDMNVLVNNSYSGDTVENAKISRCVNLHDNTGDNAGTNPDIIAVYIGVNDIKNSASLTAETFKANYLTMIENMKNAYADSDIFLFTIPQYTYSRASRATITDEVLETFNDAIREIAEEKGCVLVDLFADSGITLANHKEYTLEGLHPTPEGMDLITECFWNVLYEAYVTNANN